MINVKILGSGCPNCQRLETETRAALDTAQITYQMEKVTEYPEIMAYGVMQTPALVINEKVVSVGRIPKRQQIINWAESV
jgi:small redox-active disulfide protein 2